MVNQHAILSGTDVINWEKSLSFVNYNANFLSGESNFVQSHLTAKLCILIFKLKAKCPLTIRWRYLIFQNKYSNPDHASMVAENAKRAVAWLRDRPANTKCVTSRGSVLPSLAITTEEDSFSDGKNNDDVILDVCVNLSTTKNVEERRDNLRVVKRDVVLLTDDRNLKLKAHMTDVPVNAIPDFVRWAFPAS